MSAEAQYLGTSHLVATRALVRYNDYVFKLISRRLPKGGSIIDFGPGMGDFTERFHGAGIAVDCVEIEPAFHETLRRSVRHLAVSLDELPGKYDAIVSVNVLEHIQDDEAVLRQFHEKLKPGGLISLYLPAHQFLYSHLDTLVQHYRRYDPDELSRKVRAAGFVIEDMRMVDSVGLALCALYKWLHWGDGNLSPGPMAFYDNVVWPISRVLDALLLGKFGKSVFLLGRKT